MEWVQREICPDSRGLCENDGGTFCSTRRRDGFPGGVALHDAVEGVVPCQIKDGGLNNVNE